MRYPEIPVLSAIVAVLVLVPLPSQLRARNIATLTLILSTFLGNIITTVNTLVWNGNTRNVAPVWCDIGQIFHLSDLSPVYQESASHSTYSQPIASTFNNSWRYLALGAALCICKHLEWITSSRSGVSSRHHQFLFEITFCFIVPLISMPIRMLIALISYPRD